MRQLSVLDRLVVPKAARAVTLAGLATLSDRSMLAVVPSERHAAELAEDLALFWPDVHHLPAWETLPFEHVSPNASTMALRSEA